MLFWKTFYTLSFYFLCENMVETIKIIMRRTSISERDPFMDFCCLSGIYSSTDKNRTAMRILLLLHKYDGMNSTEICKTLGVSRGAALNHIERLIDSGFIFKYGKNYHLREDSFSEIVSQMEKDIKKTIDKMRAYAKELDENFRE